MLRVFYLLLFLRWTEDGYNSLHGAWSGSVVSLPSEQSTIAYFGFGLDGHYYCNGANPCFEEGVNFDSEHKKYQLEYNNETRSLSGKLTLVSSEGLLKESWMDTICLYKNGVKVPTLFFRVTSPRNAPIISLFTLTRVYKGEINPQPSKINPCPDFCNGTVECNFFWGECQTEENIRKSNIATYLVGIALCSVWICLMHSMCRDYYPSVQNRPRNNMQRNRIPVN